MNEFPKRLFRKSSPEAAVEQTTVKDAAAQKALGKGWYESPGEAEEALKPKPKAEAGDKRPAESTKAETGAKQEPEPATK